jgi:nucleoside recognition membrane protein YjiH
MIMKNESNKVTLKGWISLAILILVFSGAFKDAAGPLRALDFENISGNFGAIAGNVNFKGQNGTGVREGFMFALSLIPSVMFAMGIISVAESTGAFAAAQKLFTPILKPLLGIPGVAGLAFVSSFTSSDVAAVLTKELAEEKMITDDERTIFISYQYAASAVIVNTITCGAPLIPISTLSIGVIIALVIFVKLFGANMVRLIIRAKAKRSGEGRVENVATS